MDITGFFGTQDSEYTKRKVRVRHLHLLVPTTCYTLI